MTWRAVFALLSFTLLLWGPVPAAAKRCGDAVDGQDVPCACGDVVVSNLVLGDDDPVTQGPCEGDGLTVRGAAGASGLTIDLRGRTLRGTGHGAGVWLLYGGVRGARVISTGAAATLLGFRDGVVAHSDDSLALLQNVVAQSSGRDGFRIEAPGYEIRNAVARDSGRDGFMLSGKDFSVSATRAEASGRYGYFVFGSGGTIGTAGAGAVADGTKGMYGFNVWGMWHQLIEGVASNGAGDGFNLWGMHQQFRSCTASNNAGSGMIGMGMGWFLSGNQAIDNGKHGINLGGPDADDQGGNGGSGNRGLGVRVPTIQCAIGGHPCLP